MNLDSLEFIKRSEKKHVNLRAGSVNSLDMGGLYRKEALVDVGYFTNRNLNSYEEFELGARLKTADWKLLRMDRPSVRHYGHTMEAFKLLLKRWRSGYIFGIGELLRSAYRQPHFFFILKNMKQLKLYVTYIIWWFVMIVSLISIITNGWNFMIFGIIFLTTFVGMIIKKKSFYSGVYSVVASNLNAIGLCVGIFKKQRLAPSSIVNSTVIKDFKNK
jgi:GT2 family glycosyltransferase